MQARLKPARVLVFGGTGTIGSAVLAELKREGIAAEFTYFRSEERAAALSREHGFQAHRVDLSQPRNVHALFEAIGQPPDTLIYCAARNCAKPLAQVTESDWQELQAVNVASALVACQELAARADAERGGDIVLLGALDRGQALPLPVAFAATQGALPAMAMALAKELGPKRIRVNLLALGALEGGISRDLDPKLLGDFKSFSALRRVGTPAEAAAAAVWLAAENTYMNGKVLAVNGGI